MTRLWRILPFVGIFLISAGNASASDLLPVSGATDFNFEITEPTTIQIRTYAWQYGIDSMLWLYGPDGNLVTANDDYYGLDSYISVFITGNGTYRLRAGVCCGDPNRWYGSQYFVEANFVPVDPTTTTTSTTTTVPETTTTVEETTTTVEETTTTTVEETTTTIEETTTTVEEQPSTTIEETTTTEPATTTSSIPEETWPPTSPPATIPKTTTSSSSTTSTTSSTTSTSTTTSTLPTTSSSSPETTLPATTSPATTVPASIPAVSTAPATVPSVTPTVPSATTTTTTTIPQVEPDIPPAPPVGASEEQKRTFEAEVNVFSGAYDNYVPAGSTITVAQRRTMVAATVAVSTVIPSPTRRRKP